MSSEKKTAQTESEKLFEEYLRSQSIGDFEYEKEFEGIAKRPDYYVELRTLKMLFEVKELAPKQIVTGPGGAYLSPSDLSPIHDDIDSAREKFKSFKDKKWPCCLVLYGGGNDDLDLCDPDQVFGAMYGTTRMSIDFDSEKGEAVEDSEKWVFIGKSGKMMRPYWRDPQNTTISALITLRKVWTKDEGLQLGVVVFENCFASVEFPRHIFCGNYDIRYGMAEVREIRPVFVGSQVPTLQ